MPDIAESTVDAALAAEVEYARTRRPDGRGHAMPPRDQVRRLLEAAAPLLAEAAAERILAHMEGFGPHRPAGALEPVTAIGRDYRAWRRHFGIAARVAAGAFYTREDRLRGLAAQAIERGDYIRCDIPEVPGD